MPTKMYMPVEKLAFEQEERSHEYKICIGRDLCLVCCGSHGGADLVGDHLDGNPRQQLMLKQGSPQTAKPSFGVVLLFSKPCNN